MKNRYFSARLALSFIPVLIMLAFIGWTRQTFADTANIVPIEAGLLTEEAQAAQAAALNQVVKRGMALSERSEVFHVVPLSRFRPNQRELCADAACYQVDIYDYNKRATNTLIVDVTNDRILDSWQIADSYPVYSVAAGERAKALLLDNAELAAAIGRPVKYPEIALMQGEHSDVAGCDGRDICLTSVFVVDSGMVWATVNVHSDEVAAIWWSERPSDGADADKRAWADAEAAVPSVECGDTFNHAANGWVVNYEISNSDGLYAYDISYNGRTVIDSLKLVEWHVDYTVQDDDPNFNGFVDFVTCNPNGPSGKILAYGEPQILPLVEMSSTVGFEVVQDFRQTFWGFTCRYRYDQRYQFYDDGRFRVVAGGYGRGCGNQQLSEAIYRAVMRVDLTANAFGEMVDYWDGTGWTEQTVEQWFGDDGTPEWSGHPSNDDGYAFRIHDGISGYYVEPGVGQFNDGGTGDDAWVYLTKYAASEGAADLGNFGTKEMFCCNNNANQGPNLFLDVETISGQNSVFWYATDQATVTSFGAALPEGERPADAAYCWTDRNANNAPTTEYPCFAGPMFVPFSFQPVAVGLQGGLSAKAPAVTLTVAIVAVLGVFAAWQIQRVYRKNN